jgi:hypothetical protein
MIDPVTSRLNYTDPSAFRYNKTGYIENVKKSCGLQIVRNSDCPNIGIWVWSMDDDGSTKEKDQLCSSETFEIIARCRLCGHKYNEEIR